MTRSCGKCPACIRSRCGNCFRCSAGDLTLCVEKFCKRLIDENHCGNCGACYAMRRFGGQRNLHRACDNRGILPKSLLPKLPPKQTPLLKERSDVLDRECITAEQRLQMGIKKSQMTMTSGTVGSREMIGDKLLPLVKDIQLPHVNLNAMTKDELKEFIPRMLKLVTGRDEVFHGRRSARPEWWPPDIHWSISRGDWAHVKLVTENLRDIVKSCYKHMKQDHLLFPSYQPLYRQPILPHDLQENPLYVNTGPFPVSPVKSRTFPNGLFLPFCTEIFICFFCEKEFLSKEKMRCHQKTCSERPPELRKFSPAPAESAPSEPPQMSPKKSVTDRGIYPASSLAGFLKNIDLLPQKIAEKLRERKCNLDIDCKIDDLEPLSPISPVTPRTPKTLISQLSHEEAGSIARKRLSYSISIEHKADTENKEESLQKDLDTDSDSESVEALIPKKKELNLLTIPLSSLLGQRIQKNIHVDSAMFVVENSESYCKTPVKNTFLDKLRRKTPAYPVVYKPRWLAALHKENHVYKFTKSDVREFICRVDTGLNCKSYKLMKEMKCARVVVEKTPRTTLLRWVHRKALDRIMKRDHKKVPNVQSVDNSVCQFPSGPLLLSKNIDKLLGLKKRSGALEKPSCHNGSLTLSNVVSEDMEVEISNQKLTLYRSLLYEMSHRTPAVVVEDMSKTKEGHNLIVKAINKVDKRSLPRPLSKKNVPDFQKPPQKVERKMLLSKDMKSSSGGPETQRVKSVLRTVLLQSKQERLLEEEQLRQSESVFVPKTLCSLLDTSPVMMSPRVYTKKAHSAEKLDKSPGRCMKQVSEQSPDKASRSQNEGVVNSITPVSSAHLSPASPKLRDSSVSMRCSTSPQQDDVVSVMSISSDGESCQSECCMNCYNKSAKWPFPRVCQKNTDRYQQKDLTPVKSCNVLKSELLLEPLSVKVSDSLTQDDILSSSSYEMPSPESPISPSSVHPTGMSTPVKATSQGSNKKLQTASQSAGKIDRVIKERLHKNLPMGIVTRAKSVSPTKRSLRAFSSLSNSPVRLPLSGAMIKQDKFHKESLQKSTSNPYSIKSGNFITVGKSPKTDREKSNKCSSDTKTSGSVGSSKRYKRSASSPVEGASHNKLRKLSSNVS